MSNTPNGPTNDSQGLANPAGSRALVSTGHAQLLAIEGSLIEVAMVTDNRTYGMCGNRKWGKLSREDKMRDMARRIVPDPRNPSLPFIRPVTFLPNPIARTGVGYSLRTTLMVPDETGRLIEVNLVPHVIVNGMGGVIPYCKTKRREDGKKEVIPQELQCLFIHPLKPGEPFRVIPAGLAREDVLARWDQVAMALGQPTIDHIPHNLLGDKGKLVLSFKPKGLWAHPQRGEKDTERRFHHGHFWGQTVNCDMTDEIEDRLNVAEPDAQDPEKGLIYTTRRTFLIQISEQSITVRYLGREDEVKIKMARIELKGEFRVDPYEVLGITPEQADPFHTAGWAFSLARDPFKKDNPLFAYGVRVGVIDPQSPGDPSAALTNIVRQLIGSLKEDLTMRREQLYRRMTRSLPPGLEDLLGGLTLPELYFRTSGDEDLVVTWMQAQIDDFVFNWKSWLHREVRKDILAFVCEREGINIPRPQRKVPAPKVVERSNDAEAPQEPRQPAPRRKGAPALNLTEEYGQVEETTDNSPVES